MRKCGGHGVRLMIALAAWWVPQQGQWQNRQPVQCIARWVPQWAFAVPPESETNGSIS